MSTINTLLKYQLDEHLNDLQKYKNEIERIKNIMNEKVYNLLSGMKDCPIEERFDIWLKYSNKTTHLDMLDRYEYPIIRDMYINRRVWDRYQVLDLDDILDELRDGCIDRDYEDVDGLLEELIHSNFGSMMYDW